MFPTVSAVLLASLVASCSEVESAPDAGGPVPAVVPGELRPGDRFGAAIAIAEGELLVGAPGSDNGGTSSGAVLRISRTTPREVLDVVVSPTPAPGDEFGTALAVNTDASLLAVGAPGSDGAGSESGSVHVFARSGAEWTPSATVTADGLEPGDRFGSAIAWLDADLVVGAVGADERGRGAGAVYVFVNEDGAWSEQSTGSASERLHPTANSGEPSPRRTP